MGGLVARSACHYAERAGHAWTAQLDRLVFLGTPHFGASLERAGARADFLMAISRYSAPFARVGKLRSAGIRDLGHAYLCDEDWQGRDAHARRTTWLPLPRGVTGYALAASRQRHPGSAGARTRGDGLVAVDSALGRHRDAARDLGLPDERRRICYGMGHFDLLDHPEAYATLRSWLADGRGRIRDDS
jgi:hypothetical protein